MNGSVDSVDDSLGNLTSCSEPSAKKKRNLPGMPDPDSEVVALSPKTLLATNRFVCEICSRGFQRDQNLQLHRRGHNLPWKLKQRSVKDVKKRVYVCPEPSCVHHDPSRALGDLTGMKKHFSRKHGEKTFKCDKCLKKYAVQSDWKAHLKICGGREYKCDCGTLFPRRDSFITHRAFCDALARESAKAQTIAAPSLADEIPNIEAVASSPPPSLTALALSPPRTPDRAVAPSTVLVSSVLPAQNQEFHESNQTNRATAQTLKETVMVSKSITSCSNGGSCSNGSSSSNAFASLFASSTSSGSFQSETTGFSDLFRAVSCHDNRNEIVSSSEPSSLSLAINRGSSMFVAAAQECMQFAPAQHPAMSATALLQKAAQIGTAASNASLLRGLNTVASPSPSKVHQEWIMQQIEPDGKSLAAGLALGLAGDDGSGLKELMLGTPSVFGPKHITLDFLGLGVAASGGSTAGLSDLMTSINGRLDVDATPPPFGNGKLCSKGKPRSSW